MGVMITQGRYRSPDNDSGIRIKALLDIAIGEDVVISVKINDDIKFLTLDPENSSVTNAVDFSGLVEGKAYVVESLIVEGDKVTRENTSMYAYSGADKPLRIKKHSGGKERVGSGKPKGVGISWQE